MKKRLMILAIIVGIVVMVKRLVGDRSQWEGLTESEMREQLDARLPAQVPADKREQIADTIVTKMREKGQLVDDGIDLDDPIDLAAEGGSDPATADTDATA